MPNRGSPFFIALSSLCSVLLNLNQGRCCCTEASCGLDSESMFRHWGVQNLWICRDFILFLFFCFKRSYLKIASTFIMVSIISKKKTHHQKLLMVFSSTLFCFEFIYFILVIQINTPIN